jgi:thioredoxin 1
MENIKDEELERIKQRKLQEMMRRTSNRDRNIVPGINASGKPHDLTDAMFKSFTESNPLAVIDCWAPWCGPCRLVAPVLEELARDYVGRIAFGKLNVDENKQVATEYGVMSIPTLLVFKNGHLVDQIIGAMPRQRLEPRITRHLY